MRTLCEFTGTLEMPASIQIRNILYFEGIFLTKEQQMQNKKPLHLFISNRSLMFSVAQVGMLPEELGSSVVPREKNFRDVHIGGVLSNSGTDFRPFGHATA